MLFCVCHSRALFVTYMRSDLAGGWGVLTAGALGRLLLYSTVQYSSRLAGIPHIPLSPGSARIPIRCLQSPTANSLLRRSRMGDPVQQEQRCPSRHPPLRGHCTVSASMRPCVHADQEHSSHRQSSRSVRTTPTPLAPRWRPWTSPPARHRLGPGMDGLDKYGAEPGRLKWWEGVGTERREGRRGSSKMLPITTHRHRQNHQNHHQSPSTGAPAPPPILHALHRVADPAVARRANLPSHARPALHPAGLHASG